MTRSGSATGWPTARRSSLVANSNVAVGQTRRQTRSMVSGESAIISVFGTVGGIVVGTFLGLALVKASSSATLNVFSVLPAQLVVFLVVGALAGILAGIRPGRRAAHLDILTAIAAD